MTGAPYDLSQTPETDPEPEPNVASVSPPVIPTPAADSSPAAELPSSAPMTPSTKEHAFAPGDNIRVELDVEIFKMMQEGHGGWDDQLLEVHRY